MKKRLPLTIFFLIPAIIVILSLSKYIWVQTQDASVFCQKTQDAFEQDIEYISNAKIVLTAPTEAKIGELVILDASASEAVSFIWKVIPETRDFEIIEDGKRAFFTSRRPGTYLFVVAAAKSDAVDCVIHEIQIVGNPTVEDKFTILIKSWLPKNPDPRVLRALARSFTASTSAEDVSTLVKQTSVANQAVLGNKLELYKPFLMKFSEYLKQNYNGKSLEQHKELWLKLAETLKSC